ncbi:hypothetical protein VKT23_011597 [Stygiomarasmius scandens]|uniref:Uncharacterized protein n=1 Tax=Marasmiellus scandens TaxID=2682957 RepID=A0ABR1J8P2_9AGAR
MGEIYAYAKPEEVDPKTSPNKPTAFLSTIPPNFDKDRRTDPHLSTLRKTSLWALVVIT